MAVANFVKPMRGEKLYIAGANWRVVSKIVADADTYGCDALEVLSAGVGRGSERDVVVT